MSASWQAKIATPFCVLGVRTAGAQLQEIVFLPRSERELAPLDAVAESTCRQIRRYVDDPQFRFDLPLMPSGTAFQKRVWRCISAIKSGRTRSYAALASELRSAPRAVGQACGANPFPLVVPCHRVVSSTGLGGFAHHTGGFLVSVKRSLLAHEGALP